MNGAAEPTILSIVLPCYNEQESIAEAYKQLTTVLSGLHLPFEIIFVDDGSRDDTPRLLAELHAKDPRVKVICLSRNFGHQIALSAGLEHACGQAVVFMDADLQDPPEVVATMVQRWNEGWDVVYGTRIEREGESWFKLGAAKLFYRVINSISQIPIPLDTGDFRLMDRKVVDALLTLPERDRFLRGMVSWVGFSQTAVTFRRAPRVGGATKYPFWKSLRLATDGILSFSIVPLRIATILGLTVSFASMMGVIIALVTRLFTRHWVTGWTSLFLAILFLGGVQLVCIGIFGEYLGRIYGETKHRPLYVVRERLGFQTTVPRASRPSAVGQSE
jgi:glycosyltransferase involved in cell wall biosynthesis